MAEQRDRITEMSERLEAMRDESVKTRTDVATLTTVVRESIVNQRQINGKLDRLMDDHEVRIRSLETSRTEIIARLPARMIGAEKIEQHLQTQDAKIDAQGLKIDAINSTLAKWGGVIAVLSIVAQLAGPPLIKLIFGGAS